MGDDAARCKAVIGSSAWYSKLLSICEDERLTQALGDYVVTLIREVLGRKSHAVITVSAGRTFRPTYALIRDSYRTAVDWTRVICVQMDEYVGVAPADDRSLASQVLREFIDPLGIGKFIKFYDGAGEPSLHFYEQRIRDLGGLDFTLHGVGRNGHIGFNEPGSSPTSRTRIVPLADSTRTANGVDFREGVTLGMGTLREARASVIALRGPEKRDAATALLYGDVSPDYPVTYLRDCSGVRVFLDREAAPRGGIASDAMSS